MESNQRDMFAAVDGMRSTLAKREAEQAEAKRQQAEENRRRMPIVTGWVDGVRSVFPGAKVAYAKEGGVTMGQPSPAGVQPGGTAAFVQRGRGRRA